MTIDKSLKVKRGMAGVRSVLTRAERIAKLKELEKFGDSTSAIGLPKVRVAKLALKKKVKKKAEGEEGAAAAGGAKPAAGAAKAPAAKAAAAKPAAKK